MWVELVNGKPVWHGTGRGKKKPRIEVKMRKIAEPSICDHCGAVIAEHRRCIVNKPLMKALETMVQYGGVCHTGMHLHKDVDAHAAHHELKYYGLVRKLSVAEVEARGMKRVTNQGETGWWELTDLGKDFVDGKATVPVKVIVYRDKVVGHSEEMIDFATCKVLAEQVANDHPWRRTD